MAKFVVVIFIKTGVKIVAVKPVCGHSCAMPVITYACPLSINLESFIEIEKRLS